MPKPSSIALLLAESRLTALRSCRSARPITARPLFFSIPKAGHIARSPALLRAAAYSKTTRQSAIAFQSRNMSTPADHQPSKKAPKTPAVPRPSARYAYYSSASIMSKPPFANLYPQLHTDRTPQRPPHLTHEPNPPFAPREKGLQLRIRACLPRRRPLQNPRWCHPRCKRPSKTPRWTGISYGGRS